MTKADESIQYKIIETALQYGFQISPDALNLLVKNNNYSELLKEVIEKTTHSIITVKDLLSIQENIISKNANVVNNDITNNQNRTQIPGTTSAESKTSQDSRFIVSKSSALRFNFEKTAKDINSEIEIIKSYSPVKSDKGIEGFYTLFKNRFDQLKTLLESRPDCRGSIPLSSLSDSNEDNVIKILGLINAVHHTKKGGIFLDLEDGSGRGRCLLTKDAINNYIPLLDTMILATGSVKNSYLMAEEIVQPEIPTNFHSSYAEYPIFAVLLSDIHIGSKTFLEQSFLKLLNFLQGKSSLFPDKINPIAKLTKYILIAGDIVDGIGIYPGQEDDLEILDIRVQYEEAAKLLALIPEYIEVFIIPGNHDATRSALPQPPIDKSYTEALNHLSNIQLLGNPSFIKLNGVKFLMNHGRPLDDTIPAIPGASFQNQKEVLIQLLKARHLGPIYGEKTAYAPETRDFLVIDEIPDIWHLGHSHVNEYVAYRGVKAINSGTFQSQTDWQKSVNIKPTPGIVPFINLQNHDVIHLSFH